MKPAIFLDRDGTLNKDTGYTYKIEDYVLHEGVIEGLRLLHGYELIIITNQSGIARGYYSEEQMHAFNNHMRSAFKKEAITIQAVYHCPHGPNDACTCRKPAIGMVKRAQEDHDLDLQHSWVIGDKEADITLANNIGCNAVLLLTGAGKHHLEAAKKQQPKYIAPDLLQAATFITKRHEEKIISRTYIEEKANELRNQGKTIVTLNGAFDLLHEGHAYIIAEAKRQGDILIVALNDDASITKSKGPDRPINTLLARQRMLSTYADVDYVTNFSEPTPIELLEEIRPAIHANGAEYGENCVEAPIVKKYGGKIYLIPRKEGFSSTHILKG